MAYENEKKSSIEGLAVQCQLNVLPHVIVECPRVQFSVHLFDDVPDPTLHLGSRLGNPTAAVPRLENAKSVLDRVKDLGVFWQEERTRHKKQPPSWRS